MAEGNSIINLGDLGRPATMLIEKVCNAVGVLYEPRRIKRKAEAEAQAEKIKALVGLELTEIERRGIDRFVQQEARKQENIESITVQAAEQLTPDANVEALEEDWLSHFFDRCEKVSDENMQSLWSRLLAGEASIPGTYSKRTVDFVASMDKRDAEFFTRLCQFSWVIAGPLPLIFNSEDEIYKKNGIDFSLLKHLDDIGLISFDPISGYRVTNNGKYFHVQYFSQSLLFEFKTDGNNEVSIGQAIFTQAGRELANICGAEPNLEFREYTIKKFIESGLAPRNLTN
ncbi:MAG: DUF2806 domain-containing protein [Alcanivorax sp.]|nr:DUF2806 domain-containing protein [Alcanivorax sp.]